MKLFKLFVALGGVSLLVACGGGGGGGDCNFGVLACDSSSGASSGASGGASGGAGGAGNVAPVANAGSPQTVVTGNEVTLNGSASSDANNDRLTYQWSIVSAPAGFNLSANEVKAENSTAVKPTFIPTLSGAYVFGLVVSDGKVSSPREVVSVTVTPENLAPVANAGIDQSVTVNTQVTLDGSASTDPNRDLLKHAWTWVSQPPGSNVAFDAATSPKPKFTPVLDGAYVASLVVTDDKLLKSAPDYVTVTVSRANAAPVAVAGTDQNVTTGATVTLNGSSSSDANSDLLTYKWSLSKPSGSTAALVLTVPSQPTFVADVSGDYVANLIVNDGKVDSAALSSVRVTAAATNSAPSAVGLATPATVSLASLPAARLVTLDGAASTDANFDRLTYVWTLSSVPVGSTATLTVDATNRAKSTFTPTVAGVYVATLVVNDGKVNSAPIFVSVTVVPANAAPVAVAGPNQTVVTGATVTLNGMGSNDANGDPLTYRWTLNKPTASGATLVLTVPAQPTFVADVAGDYVATLMVNDGSLDSAALSTVRVTAAAPNIIPTAVAVATPTTVSLAALPAAKLVTLDGSGSSDANFDRLTYSWVLTTVPVGNTATLTVDPANAARSTFTPNVAGVYVASLVVNDGKANSTPATVVITANP
jgi:hypothetical protein